LSLSNIPFAVICTDLEGNITDINEFAEHVSGYQSQELIGQKVEILIPLNLAKSHVKHRENYQRGSGVVATPREIQLLNKSGQVIYSTIRISEVEEGYAVFITETKAKTMSYEQGISKGAKKALSSIEEAFWEWNVEDNLVYYSAHFMNIFGYTKEAFTGPMSFTRKLVSADDLKNIYQHVNEYFSQQLSCINITIAIKTKDNDVKWITIIGKVSEYKDGKPYKVFGSVKDVSENYQLIERLKTQNNYLLLAEGLSQTGHWHLNTENNSLFWSEQVFHIHGLSPDKYHPNYEDAIGFYDKEERLKVVAIISNAVENKVGFHFKSCIINNLGDKVKIEVVGKLKFDGNQSVIGIFGVVKNITKSEDVFEKLKLLALVNYTIKVPVFFIDEKDTVVYQDISPQIGTKNSVLFNYINFSITDYLEFKRKAKTNGQIKKSHISFDNYNSVFDFSVTYEADEGIYIWIIENVTDKFRQEQQQVISNRLALLGNTFGNVSHDINNVLGVALGATEMLELRFAQGEKNISTYIERVKNAIDKGKSVTERLLAFTRKPAIKVVSFDPLKEIEDNQYLFKQLLLSTIDFTVDTPDLFCEIHFPQGEFINILLNLVLNSQDAIQEQGLSGKIQISTNINCENHLEIHVKDSGIGIEKDNIAKIFDPFYSSKSVNKGNGIGLANVYSTVYKHNGKIQVEGKSDLGGAHFTLIFNCKQHKYAPENTQEFTPSMNLVGQRILILDDEISIAEFIALFLESEGAVTDHIQNKVDLERVLASEQVFDIFITDMILPDMSGREAVDIVLEKFPRIKIFSISGYIAEEDKNWTYPVLRKPFNSKELARFLIGQI
jgi:PAS domain S-box-containing protein